MLSIYDFCFLKTLWHLSLQIRDFIELGFEQKVLTLIYKIGDLIKLGFFLNNSNVNP